MASKVVFFLLITCFLVINTKVSSEWDESVLIESPALAPAPSPIYGSPPLPPPQATPAPSPVPLPPPQASPAPSPVPLPPPQASPAPSPVPLPPPPQAAPAPSPVVEPPTPSAPPARRPRNILECIPLCVVRCKFHPRILRCMTSCLTCCGRCRCVPPGQYGNKEQCGTCYTGMKTRNGTPRCP